MPIISRVHARSTQGKLLYGLIFLVLSLGAVTMIYPFALMVSGSIRSDLDQNDLDLIPRYLFDEQVLYQKFLELKYAQNITALNRARRTSYFSFRDVETPQQMTPAAMADLETFVAETSMPLHWQMLGTVAGVRTTPPRLRQLRRRLEQRLDGDIEALGRQMANPIKSWDQIRVRVPEWSSPLFQRQLTPVTDVYDQLLQESPLAERQLLSLSGYFLDVVIYPTYGRTPQAFNQAHQLQLQRLGDFVLPDRVPGPQEPLLRDEWTEFVRQDLHPSFVVLEGVPAEAYQRFLAAKFERIDELNHEWGTQYADFGQVPLPQGQWLSGAQRSDYHEFLTHQPAQTYRLVGPEYAWRRWLVDRYTTVEALNHAHQTQYTRFAQADWPMDQLEYRFVREHAGALRWSCVTTNYVNVFDALFVRGRAFLNTLIYCSLAILTALLVNPLAAYALSRFQLPGAYKVLLFLMATMSFPPMVTLIPTFIMLQKLDLLNTFAALVLPGAANGYMIFLLKGFFDSLPKDLYEAATLDGASEVRIFFQITMALSKPILAVVALGAFTHAYTAFLGALLVCPREDMWMLSVWLYQFQMNSAMSAVFASVLVASLPTLLIFILTQNIIMRGIVVPVEK